MSMEMDYVAFVENRHRIWEQRQAGGTWNTPDRILATHKFTNVFRVLDPGTQFILTDLLSDDPKTTLMRMFLYRHTGIVAAWRDAWVATGDYPAPDSLEEAFEAFSQYRDRTGRAFTKAYLVFPQSQVKGTDKLRSIFDLTDRVFNQEGFFDRFQEATTQEARFKLLRSNKGVGDFMSMQILTDWGYQCGEDRENDFVVAGPGSRKGALAVSPGRRPEDTIQRYTELFETLGTVTLGLPNGTVRTPSLMDIQNTFCEWGKYLRHSRSTSNPAPYTPAHPGKQPLPVLPNW